MKIKPQICAIQNISIIVISALNLHPEQTRKTRKIRRFTPLLTGTYLIVMQTRPFYSQKSLNVIYLLSH